MTLPESAGRALVATRARRIAVGTVALPAALLKVGQPAQASADMTVSDQPHAARRP
jgi:hypothetical protein